MKEGKGQSSRKVEDLRIIAEKTVKKRNSAVNEKLPPDEFRRLIYELEIHQVELEMQNEELRRAQVELEKSRTEYSDLFDYAPAGYFLLNLKGLITGVNLTGASMLQIERGLLIDNTFSRFVHDDDKDAFYLLYRQMVNTVKPQSIYVRLKRRDGSVFHVHMECLPVKDVAGGLYQIRMVISDVTERIQAEEGVSRANTEWERTFDTIPDIIMVIDDQCRITRANKSLSDRLGIVRKGIIGRKCHSVMHGTDEPPSYCPHSKASSLDQEQIAEVYEEKLKGHFMLSFTPVYGSDGKKEGAVAVWRDISNHKKIEEKLRASTITDDLTGILNRRGFLTLSEQQCKIAGRNKKHVSLIYIDLDGLKIINDNYGHKEGDRALIRISRIIKKTFREADIVGRIGGDEFAVLLTEQSKCGTDSTVLQHINNNVRRYNEQSSCGYELSISLGFASSDPEGRCLLEELLISADSAMYENKRLRKKTNIGERRKMNRYKTGGNCRIEASSSDTTCVKNISSGGLCLSNMDHLISNKFHSMPISIDNNTFLLKGLMVWSKLTKKEDYEAGIKLIGLSDTDRERLSAFISGIT